MKRYSTSQYSSFVTKITIGIMLAAAVFFIFHVQNQQATATLESTSEILAPQYVSYSDERLAMSLTQGRTVLFFAANWCGTCSLLDDELLESSSSLPSDVLIVKVDYDTEKVMRQKYDVVVQHTLVLLDESGNEQKKWVGGDLDVLKQELL